MTSQKSMQVTVTANQANYPDLIPRANSGKEHFIVEEEGKPVAAIISKQEYDDLMQEHEIYEQDKQARLKKFRQAARAIGEAVEKTGLTEDEVMARVDEVRQQFYEEQYGNN